VIKAISVLSLSFLVLVSGLGNGMYAIVYDIGQQSLIDQYCVNKAKDDCCRAKCRVTKIVQQAEKESDTGSSQMPGEPETCGIYTHHDAGIRYSL